MFWGVEVQVKQIGFVTNLFLHIDTVKSLLNEELLFHESTRFQTYNPHQFSS